ncbi:SUF system Fe-S cluster assembly protein [Aquibaculum sediminis]|uniref:SUF system Fe-S cluster assembly protein n=1 Tax=Aquibaculum sediminis TaxID=3231907 RepID=UPI00345398F8
MSEDQRDKLRSDGLPEDLPARPHYNPYLWAGGGTAEQVEEGFTARAGEPRQEGEPVATQEQIVEAMQDVYDPEIPVNIYDLGLIYDLTIAANGDVGITMTLTAPACPVAGEMPGQVADRVAMVEGVGLVSVTLTWDPPWDKDRMSEDAKLALGIF